MSGPRKNKAAGPSWVDRFSDGDFREDPFEPVWPAITSTRQINEFIHRAMGEDEKTRALIDKFYSLEPGPEAVLAFGLGFRCGIVGGRATTIEATQQLLLTDQ